MQRTIIAITTTVRSITKATAILILIMLVITTVTMTTIITSITLPIAIAFHHHRQSIDNTKLLQNGLGLMRRGVATAQHSARLP